MSAAAQPITASYDYWRNALAGNFGPVHDGDPQPGFYRKRTGKAAGYVPVAIWPDASEMLATVDGQKADANEVWTFCCTHPVSYEQFDARVKTGKWHDEDDAVTESLTHRTDTNNPPTDEAEILKGEIEAASAGVAAYTEIKDDETAAKAQSLRSRLLELSGKADKAREAKKRPHLDAGREIDNKYQPLIKAADAAALLIRKAMSAHETRKANEIAAAEKAREEARIKAERERVKLEAAGKLASAPVPTPTPPPPVPVQQTTIKGGYGRGASVRVIKVARVVDQDKAYMALRTHKELVELIAALAQRAAKAGVSVDGVEVTEERDVS